MIHNSRYLVDKFMNKAKEICQPINATIEIIHTCPLKCRHCYNFDRLAKPITDTKNNLQTKEILNVIEELAQAGTLNLSITGGEPLLHPDLEQIVRKARELAFIITIKTNGVLLQREKIIALKDAGVNDFEISLYGFENTTYEKFTDLKSGADKVKANIEQLLLHGIRPEINIILHRYNVSELEQMIEFCQQRALSFQLSLEITDRQDQTNTSDYVLTHDQYKELMTGRYREYFLGDNPEGGLQCPCAVTNCAVGINGDVYPCIGAPMKAGNIRDNSFLSIWKNSDLFKKIRNIKDTDFKECYTCPDKTFCQRSSGSAFINTGNYLGKDPRTCEVTQIRRTILEQQGS